MKTKTALLLGLLSACAEAPIEVTFGPAEHLAEHDTWSVVTEAGCFERPVVNVTTDASDRDIVTLIVEPTDCGRDSVVQARSSSSLDSLEFPLTRDVCDGLGSIQQHTGSGFSFGVQCTCSSTYKWCKNCDNCTWYYTGTRCP